jgi:hypothetical protein
LSLLNSNHPLLSFKMNPLEEDVYTDFVRPENMVGVESSKSPPTTLTRQPATSTRRYRLSLSPLDSLQAEFKKYNSTEPSGSPRLSQPSNQRVLVSTAFHINSFKYSHTLRAWSGMIFARAPSTVCRIWIDYCLPVKLASQRASITIDVSFVTSKQLRWLY